MLIWCLRSNSDYYHVENKFSLFVETVIIIFFQDSLMDVKFKRTAVFETEIFCNIINVFTLTFYQLNASLIYKSINFY